ncbi:TPA: ChiQ/YbfN family lipoprotein [Klebsiella variicola]
MKKMLLIAMMASGLVACATSPAPKEDTKLKDAYSACINTAEGNPDKIEACQSVLNVLKEDKQHQQFANQESVRVLDYQQCIQATRPGNDQAVKARCDQIWKEIRSNNTTH